IIAQSFLGRSYANNAYTHVSFRCIECASRPNLMVHCSPSQSECLRVYSRLKLGIVIVVLSLGSSASRNQATHLRAGGSGFVVAKLAYKWRVLITIVFGISMIVLDSTVVNVAFPTLRREFDVGLDEGQWIISIYVLALGIATPLAGILADRFKLKRVYIAGLCIFLLGSLVSGLAPNFGLLVGARALQGIGGGIALPLSTVMLFTTFEDHEQGRAFGIYGVVMVAAPAIGPILGGLLADTNHWRWIFFINIPIGLIGIGLATRILRATEAKRSINFNPISFITIVIGYGCVLYAASIVNHYGWLSVPVLSFLAVAVVSLSVFAVYDLKYARDPLLELSLYKNPTFLKAN